MINAYRRFKLILICFLASEIDILTILKIILKYLYKKKNFGICIFIYYIVAYNYIVFESPCNTLMYFILY